MNEPLDIPTDKIPSRRTFMIMAFVSQGGILIFAVVLGWLLGERFWQALDFSPRAIAIGAALSLPLIVAVIASAESSSTMIRQIQIDFDRVVKLFKNCTVLDLFLVSMLAGLGEEALFRGVLQPYIAHWTNPTVGLVAASLIFGFIHFISRVYVLLVFVIGLYLGALYLYFDDLVIPMTTHAFYDFIALLYATRFRSNHA